MPGPVPPAAPVAPPLSALLEDIARLLAASPSPDAFYPAFLERVLAALGGQAGAVWGRGPGGEVHLLHPQGREVHGPDALPVAEALRLAGERRQPLWLPPQVPSTAANGNPPPASPDCAPSL
jgi:hypothetical protein